MEQLRAEPWTGQLLVCPAGRGGLSEEAKKHLAKSRAAALRV